ncbi:MAG: Eco57I restriction-modification methylase domain-containing protein [bacterium]
MKTAATKHKRTRQQELGQFLTATPIADFMALMFGQLPSVVRLLDAGAGAGALTHAFISRLCGRNDDVRAVEATVYELDPRILDSLSETMLDCQQLCSKAGIQFSFTIHPTDFIQEMSTRLSGDMFGRPPPVFDVAIANPPYRKISADSVERRALRSVGVETSNLYTGFIALIQRLLVSGGQLVGITPRSFCNGPYFRPFREDFLSHLDLRRLHIFESRKAAFRTDSVLQENIIFYAVKGVGQSREVVVSSSSGEPGDAINETIFPFGEIVHPHDAEKFIHIPSATCHATAKKTMDGLGSSLASLGVTVSTGRVVDFRLKESLRKEPERGTVPLVYPCHFNGGTIHWPKLEARKPNAILDNDETHPWLVPSGIYLLTKRFTSKEERRRLVACMFDPDQVNAKWLGFENHLNYLHANGHGLERALAIGLFAFLNSTVVDHYFRRFSGHTQVNATDLRTLAYPDRDTLQAMGREINTLNLSQEEIDQLVRKHLHVHR